MYFLFNWIFVHAPSETFSAIPRANSEVPDQIPLLRRYLYQSVMVTGSSAPIAVVGMGFRFPGGATDPEKLWTLLAEGRSCWTSVPKDRFNEAAFYHPNADASGTHNHRGGQFLTQDLAAFDAGFFQISPAEAHGMDPQQRILLETTYDAFENSGATLESVRGSNTAVYVAKFSSDYDRNIYKDTDDIPKYHTTGTGEAILANRISYIFDLKGPSITLDTGCSGSLVALHYACQSLRTGEVNMAIAGGVNLIMSPDHMIGMTNLQYVRISLWSLHVADEQIQYAQRRGEKLFLRQPRFRLRSWRRQRDSYSEDISRCYLLR